MSTHPLRVLLVESDAEAARRLREQLHGAGPGPCDVFLAERLAEAREWLARERPAAVLLTLDLPDSTGLDTLGAVLECSPGVAVVVTTDRGDDELAVGALRAGAQDCVVRGALDGAALRRVVRFAMERAAAASLRESGSSYRTLFEQSPDGIFLTAPDGRILAANPAACRLLGYTEEELRSRGVDDVVDPADRQLRDAVEECRRAGRFRGELAMVHREGRRIPVELTCRLFPDASGEARTSMIVRDVTPRRRAEQRERFLAEAGRALASPLDHDDRMQRVAGLAVAGLADWCVIVVPGNGAPLRAAAVAARDTAREEVLGELLRLYPYGAGRGGRLVERAISAGESLLIPDVSRDVLVDAAHDERHLRLLERMGTRTVMVVPLVVEGRSLGAILLGAWEEGRRFGEEDLSLATELGRRAGMAVHNAALYRRSQLALAEAEQAMRHRDEVLGVVAHDLKNPLSAVQMYAFLLAESPLLERERRIVEGITRAVGRMDRLIRDLVEVSRIEAGSLVLDREAVQAGALVWEAVQAAEADAEYRGITLTARVPDREAWVNADHHRLRQVLDNLIGNALKFTPAGGEITIGAEAREDEVWFSVADTGPGIAAEDLPHLFDRFYQARHTRKGGAGLGLSIVKGIVEAHGGRVAVESAPGHGATFRFTLPALAPGNHAGREPMPASAHGAAESPGLPGADLLSSTVALPPTPASAFT